MEASPLDDFRRLLAGLPVRPLEAEGGNRFERLTARLDSLRGKAPFRQPSVAIFAGAHGVARHGVSVRTVSDARGAIAALEGGTAPLNGICSAGNLGLGVFDLALDIPAGDIAETAALSGREAAATVAFGMEALVGGKDLLVLAGLGAGIETAAAAVGAALHGSDAGWAESIDAPTHVRLRRAEAIGRALSLHGDALGDPLDVLRRLGGREIAAMAGAIAAAATQNVPVILDGDAAVAAALVLSAARPGAAAHCVLAHRLPVAVMEAAAAEAGLEPLLDLGLFSGEGQAGALAAGIAMAAARAG